MARLERKPDPIHRSPGKLGRQPDAGLRVARSLSYEEHSGKKLKAVTINFSGMSARPLSPTNCSHLAWKMLPGSSSKPSTGASDEAGGAERLKGKNSSALLEEVARRTAPSSTSGPPSSRMLPPCSASSRDRLGAAVQFVFLRSSDRPLDRLAVIPRETAKHAGRRIEARLSPELIRHLPPLASARLSPRVSASGCSTTSSVSNGMSLTRPLASLVREGAYRQNVCNRWRGK